MGFIRRLFYLSTQQKLPRLRHHLTNGRALDTADDTSQILLEAGLVRDWSGGRHLVKRYRKTAEDLFWELSKRRRANCAKGLKTSLYACLEGLPMIPTAQSLKDYLKGFTRMMGHTHALIGSSLALGVAIASHTAPNTTLLLLGAGALAALLPDIDHPQAPIRRKLGCVGHLIFGGLKHRGLTHTLVALVAVVAAALTALPQLVGAVVVIGYLSHILADMVTVSGLPVFWPYKKVNYHLLPKRLRLTTNTWPEHLLSLALLVVIGSQIPYFIPQF